MTQIAGDLIKGQLRLVSSRIVLQFPRQCDFTAYGVTLHSTLTLRNRYGYFLIWNHEDLEITFSIDFLWTKAWWKSVCAKPMCIYAIYWLHILKSLYYWEILSNEFWSHSVSFPQLFLDPHSPLLPSQFRASTPTPIKANLCFSSVLGCVVFQWNVADLAEVTL